jgi:hypothetical protein
MTAAYNYGYEEGNDLTSFVTVRHGRYSYDMVARKTEIAGTDKKAYGGRQLATDSAAPVATKKNGQLKCSDCKLTKDDEAFPNCKTFQHRRCRGYQCNDCVDRRNEAARRRAFLEAMQSPVINLIKMPKIAKNLNIRAVTA